MITKLIIDRDNIIKKKNYINNSDRIDVLETVQHLIWDNYIEEKDPYKRTLILEKIVEFQPSIWMA
jgi:hypothetical protein